MQRALSVSRMTGNRSTFPEWYQAVVREADLAEISPVRGCMVIKPWGYGIWEKIQRDLDRRIKDTGHVNAYFPLFIPLELLRQGGRARRGLRQGDGGGHPPPAEVHRRQAAGRPRRRAGRAADRAADLRDHHRRRLPALDPELSRPAAADQPVGQRGALGDAHAAVPAHHGVPLAGGPHRARRPPRTRARRPCACWRSTAPSPRSPWRCR